MGDMQMQVPIKRGHDFLLNIFSVTINFVFLWNFKI